MENRYDDGAAAEAIARWKSAPYSNEDVALRTYSARLLGSEPTLVLHGGGNCSVKTVLEDDTGEATDVLCVKGSGWDLATIEPAGFPAVRLDGLRKLRARASLSDEAMVNAQRTRLLDASAPNPSVETLLHAFLPAKFVDHSHANATLSISDQPEAEAVCRKILGDRVGYVPYVMPGFDLAKLAAEVAEANPHSEGLLLLHHGLFTWGETAEESYRRHIEIVTLAEQAVAEARQKATQPKSITPAPLDMARVGPVLRGRCGVAEGRRYIFDLRQSPAIEAFLRRKNLPSVSQRGTPTPDHVIRTKRVPLLLELTASQTDEELRAHVEERVDSFAVDYAAYVERQRARSGRDVVALDASPRVALIPGLGLIGMGANRKAARIAADLYEQTIETIEGAEAIGQYQVITEDDFFDMEYWSLEQAKLGKRKARALDGHVVFLTGAASGIGLSCAEVFAAAGAELFLVDRDAEKLEPVLARLGASGCAVDVTNEAALRGAVDACVRTFGGLDGIISNAGVAIQAPIEASGDDFRRSFEVNLFAHQTLASSAFDVMRRQGRGGFLLFNASKAAFNPGARFGPYAVPKAALVALVKQYALEGGELDIRSSCVNADRIRTGLLPEDVVEKRAAARGLSADAYFKSNLLKKEVHAEDVARAFLYLATAPSTTAAVMTVDGGNIAASPR
ncbi:MAG: bifunctional aldolase/short-chain dehydrogenase [Myxococcota bacterium]